VGTKAIQHVFDEVDASLSKGSKSNTSRPIKTIYMHVQTSNIDARRFYERNGFVEVALIPGYYKKIEPPDAWVLEKKIGLADAGDSKET